ncbi:hypothetical protein BOO25_01455 [Vibrio navarrensis]|uniref:HD-GYP domain-containing protein n=1 Tax=Vibrio navarrensis TaxID=29495 RepID=UPI00192F3C2E|nr:HD domain-containing phosphohydrolase [Vibrio navarrensis]MBE3667609.1 hypothetical protein [Vibrio navarrensis]
MDLWSDSSNCAYFYHASSLNDQLKGILHRMQVHDASIERVSFAVFDQEHSLLKTYADSSASTELAHYRAHLDDFPALARCVNEKSYRIIDDLNELSPSVHVKALIDSGYRSSIAAPCFEQDKFIGFLFVNSRKVAAFTPELVEKMKPYFDIIQFAIFSEYQIVHAIAKCAEKTQALSPSYNKDSLAHKERISRYTRIIANETADVWDFDDETIEHLCLFSRFHDIGKVNLAIDLLCKTANLDGSETSKMRNHIESGVEIMDKIIESLGNPHHPSITLLTQVMAYHHEFLDGSGYPFGLQGDQIPPVARVVSAANIFDALTTHRPYRQAWSITHALLEMEKMVAEGKLDKACVNALREHQDQLKQIVARFPEHDPKDGFY